MRDTAALRAARVAAAAEAVPTKSQPRVPQAGASAVCTLEALASSKAAYQRPAPVRAGDTKTVCTPFLQPASLVATALAR